MSKCCYCLGTFIAILTVLVLTIRWAVEEFTGPNAKTWETGVHLKNIVDFCIIGVTVLVVAVPEGLPLAVTLSLAYSVRVSLKDSSFITSFDMNVLGMLDDWLRPGSGSTK